MIGVEIDMIVTDSLAALKLYEAIFDVERIEVPCFPKGQNEAVFSVYGVRFHLLDENPGYGMVAPKAGDPKPMWLNITVPDIEATYAKALKSGCTEILPVTEIPDFGISNAMFSDPFGYSWMLHQVHRIVSFEERVQLMKQQMKGG